MRKKVKSLFTVLLLALTITVLSGCGGGRNSGNSPYWEYTISMVRGMEARIEEANRLGQEGWQLVMVHADHWIFKRALP